jgi:ribosome-binding factor A
MSFRANRLAEEIKREVTELLQMQLKDPRISALTSIMDVQVSRDLRYAKLFVSVYGDQEAKQKTMEGLQQASGYIRSEIGKRIRLRYIPEISFHPDASIEHGMKINQLLRDMADGDKPREL